MTNERLIELARQLGNGISFVDATELSEALGDNRGDRLAERTIAELCDRLEAETNPEIEDDNRNHPADCMGDCCVRWMPGARVRGKKLPGDLYYRDGKTRIPNADAPPK
jgi:hypothetical protein